MCTLCCPAAALEGCIRVHTARSSLSAHLHVRARRHARGLGIVEPSAVVHRHCAGQRGNRRRLRAPVIDRRLSIPAGGAPPCTQARTDAWQLGTSLRLHPPVVLTYRPWRGVPAPGHACPPSAHPSAHLQQHIDACWVQAEQSLPGSRQRVCRCIGGQRNVLAGVFCAAAHRGAVPAEGRGVAGRDGKGGIGLGLHGVGAAGMGASGPGGGAGARAWQGSGGSSPHAAVPAEPRVLCPARTNPASSTCLVCHDACAPADWRQHSTPGRRQRHLRAPSTSPLHRCLLAHWDRG